MQEIEIFELKRKYELKKEKEAAKEIAVTSAPTMYSREKIEALFSLQKTINTILYRISEDDEMLTKISSNMLEVEGELFVSGYRDNNIYGILERIRKERKRVNSTRAMLIRSDYIEDQEGIFKQVEINAISCAFLISGYNTNLFHDNLLSNDKYVNHLKKEFPEVSESLKEKRIFISEAPKKFQEFIKNLSEIYKESHGTKGTFILLDNISTEEASNYQEKKRILKLVKEIGVEVEYVSVKAFLSAYTVENNRFFYKKKEVSIVYFRWLYNADQYTESIIKMRIDLESTYAICIPDVSTQIVGLKCFQRLLAKDSFLERYIDDKTIKNHFVSFLTINQYINGSHKKEYVLKPLHEGGGHNYFKEEVDIQIRKMTEQEQEEYFLMERIDGKTRKNSHLGKTPDETIGEVGILGIFISSAPCNESAGYILRTKYARDNEGGVCAGFGALDTIIW
ncbi:glutathione synthase [Nematocida sp. LUAm3]|nr:glutathione synthase [Nematocida sp. LUAm3]KAI5173696.1 glutathione synthase [Nematocida sp. LUAm2]KAI5176918.1 glutathione synthase [Nematocida sp. LUAm1]